jgi:hypothetical protein
MKENARPSFSRVNWSGFAGLALLEVLYQDSLTGLGFVLGKQDRLFIRRDAESYIALRQLRLDGDEAIKVPTSRWNMLAEKRQT